MEDINVQSTAKVKEKLILPGRDYSVSISLKQSSSDLLSIDLNFLIPFTHKSSVKRNERHGGFLERFSEY